MLAGVILNIIKMLLANDLSTCPTTGNPFFSPRSLLKNPSVCSVLRNWVFDNFIFS